jgi:hypothetical protein
VTGRPAALVLLAGLAVVGAARAEMAVLDAATFEAVTTGRTFYYRQGGQSYGAEQYLPGRRVIWAFTGDDCRKGYWYPEGPEICFVYEDEPDPQCWTFRESEAGLIARFRGDEAGTPLVARQSSPEPMACLGPDVGV